MDQSNEDWSYEMENILLRTIEDVLGNKAGASELSAVLETARQNLKDTRQEFDMTVSGQPPHIQGACKSIIFSINQFFEEYEKLFNELNSYVHTFDKSTLESIPERIDKVSLSLDKAFFDFRQKGLIAMGPTKVPGINLLIHTCGRILSGEKLEALLKEQAQREAGAIEETIAEMAAQPQGADFKAMREAFEMYQGNVSAILESADNPDLEKLKQMVRDLIRTGLTFDEAARIKEFKGEMEGPTRSPMVNRLIVASDALRDGSTDMDTFLGITQELWDQLESLKFKYNAILRNPPSSSVVEEEASFLGDTIQNFEETLNLIYDFTDTENYELLDEGLERLKALIAELEQSITIFRDISEREGKTPCVRCGHYNEPGARICEKCRFVLPIFSEKDHVGLDFVDGAGLPKAPEQESDHEVVMTENVQKLFDAADGVTSGTVGRDEFEQALAWMERLLAEAYHSAVPVEAALSKTSDENARKTMGELADLYVQGLEDFEVGLSFLRQFFADASPQAIQAGKQMIWQGMAKLQKISKAQPSAAAVPKERKWQTPAGTLLKSPAPKPAAGPKPSVKSLGERMKNR